MEEEGSKNRIAMKRKERKYNEGVDKKQKGMQIDKKDIIKETNSQNQQKRRKEDNTEGR